MFLLSNFINPNKCSVILCDDKNVKKMLTYKEVIKISEIVETLLVENINQENLCLGLLMNHNAYIPSIILSLQKLNFAFVFLTAKNVDKTLNHLKCQWVLSLENTNKIPLFEVMDRLTLEDSSLILWGRKDALPIPFNFRDIFCVVQTSGSTGENKFIRVTQTCIEVNASHLREIFHLNEEDVIFWGTNLTFDPFLVEMILALQSGASLLIVPYKILINPSALYKALFNVGNITFLQVVPSVFLRWSDNEIKQILCQSQLKILAFGGEHFPRNLLFYKRSSNLRIFNLYGITEVSCWATLHEITTETENDEIPIGKPLAATIVELRDEFGNLVNLGQGSIYIGSSTRICYINEESTEQLSGIVYRDTGDIAEAKENKLFLIGRRIKIIKRFGHKINLTEIEKEIFRETKLKNRCIWSHENKKLLTFVLVKNLDVRIKGKVLDKLRVKLLNTLSQENFPDFIDIVTSFPLTSHGKIDEKALENIYHSPIIALNCNDIFRLLWCKYSGISSDDLDEFKHYTFFEIGGNSISALQLLSEIKEIFMCESLQELVSMIFENDYADCLTYFTSHKPVMKITKEKVEVSVASRRNQIETGLTILWIYDLKACVDSSPLVFQREERVYIAVGSFSHKFVIFYENGQVFYETSLPDCVESTPSISPCQHFILIGCFNGIMYCVNFVKKQIVWEFTTGEKIKGSACFCSKQNAVFGSYDKIVYCVSILDGSELWHTLLDGSISSSPVYHKDTKCIYTATTRGACFCLNEENGEILWKTNCSGPIFGTPCFVNSHKNIIFPTVQGELYCLQTKSGELLWKHQANGYIFSSLVALQNYILFGCHDKTVNILNISEFQCTLHKKIVLGSEISTTPFVYCIRDNDVIVAACNSGVISIVNINTSEIQSTIELPGEIFSSPVVYGNKIFVGCRDNNFYCIELN